MMRTLFAAFTAVCLLSACNNEGGNNSVDLSAAQKTDQGYAIKMHIDKEGNAAMPGELAIFNLTQRFDDSIVYRSIDRGREERVPMPDPTKMGGRKTPPVFDLLAKMSAGDSASIFVPIDSLGPNLQPWQKDKEFLIFDVAMIEVKNLKEKENEIATVAAEVLAKYKDGSLDNIQSLDNGLKYVVIEKGDGAKPAAGQTVSADYFGVLVSDGSMFDNSFSRGQPFRFPLGGGRVIKGWDIGFAELNVGDKAMLFIPADLGYGAAGSPPKIPADSELAFYVELQGAN